MLPAWRLRRAGAVLRAGGVLAYPTEGVYGLGCLPLDAGAVYRLLAIKRRRADKGLIVIAAGVESLRPYFADSVDLTVLNDTADRPTTWLIPARDTVPDWLRGRHDTLAVRITRHPLARALCHAVGPLVSTSANRAGRPAARYHWQVRRQLGNDIDGLLSGQVGDQSGPSQIRDARTGALLRP